MSRLLNQIMVMVAMVATITGSASAQSGLEAEHGHGEPGHVCGTTVVSAINSQEALERTRILNPAFYQQLMERASKPDDRRGLMSSAAGFEQTFSVLNQKDKKFDEVKGVLVFRGKWARIWVDVRDTGKARVKNMVPKLAYGLDTATGDGSRNPDKGIIENDQEVFGLPPVNQFSPESPATDFLLTDIQDDLSSSVMKGFFYSVDQGNEPNSNRMNILYIDSNEGLAGSNAEVGMLNTIAHEYQHLLHYRANPESQTVYNEGCSEVASIILGYRDRYNNDYLGKTNLTFFRWSHDDKVGTQLELDYQRAMTFVHYMYEQYGERFLTAFVSTRSEGMERIAQALTAIGREPDWKMTLNGYAVANYVGQRYPDSRLVYRTRLSTRTPTAEETFTGDAEIVGSGSMAVQQFAAGYVVYNNPGNGLKFNFKTSSQQYKVMAMLYKGGTVPVQVTEVEPGRDYTFAHNGSAPYDKIVLAVVNHSFNSHTVNWTVERVTLGVDDVVSGTTGGLAISEIVPNPSRGASEVKFTNARAGAVTVDIYSTTGELVKRVVDGERYEAGEHGVRIETGDMRSGVYMVRVSQESGMTNGALVVLNK